MKKRKGSVRGGTALFVERASEKIGKLSGEQLGRILSSVGEENELFEALIQSVPCGLVIADESWRAQKFNKAAKRLLPFSTRRTKDRPFWEAIESKEVAAFISTCAEQKRVNSSDEFSVFSGDGRAHFVTVSLLPFVRSGEMAGSIIFIEDVTAQRQQEILLRRMESLNGLTALAASVAHEIKNPLGAISIHVQLLQKALARSRAEGQLPDESFAEKRLEVITEEIERLNKIVMDFLFAVRPLKAELVLSDPDEIIERTLEFFKPDLEGANITLSLALCQSGVRLLLDEKLLREALLNLLQNAKAAILSRVAEGGKVALKSLLAGETYVLTVADNGCGMSEEEQAKVFEPYYTTKASGTGLGLTTVYKIVKEFQGDIAVSSEAGRGTVFTIQLPVPQRATHMLGVHSEQV